MCQQATMIECLTAPSAFLWPRRGLRRAYWAAREVSLQRVAASAASSSAQSSHLEPLRVLPERRLPADWWLPEHCPAHEASALAVAKLLMSTPISAMRHSAVRR